MRVRAHLSRLAGLSYAGILGAVGMPCTEEAAVVLQTVLPGLAPAAEPRRAGFQGGELSVEGEWLTWDSAPPAPRPAPALPSLGCMIRGAMVTAGTIVAQAVSGGPVLASCGEKARRLAICRGCPHLTPAGRCGNYTPPGGELVKGCGCIMEAKAGLDAARCPAGRW